LQFESSIQVQEALGPPSASSGFALVTRGFDATPVKVFFGDLAKEICPHAKYLVRQEDDSGWRLVDLQTYKQLKGKRFAKFLPKWGVVDLFAQEASIHLSVNRAAGSDRAVLDGQFICPPCVLGGTNGSVMFNALEKLCPGVDQHQIARLSGSRKLVMIHGFPDSCRANKRLLAHIEDLCASHPNVLVVFGSCTVHLVRLVIAGGSAEFAIVGDLYAVEYISHLPSHYNRMATCLRRYIRRTLELFPGCPPAEYAVHTGAVLDHTLRREKDLTRARLDYEYATGLSSTSASNEEKVVEDVCAKLLAAFPGDIRSPQPQWYCGDVPVDDVNKDDIADLQCRAALDAGVVATMGGGKFPSKGRWGSVIKSATRAGTGFMLHDLLGATAHDAFIGYEDGALDEADAPDDPEADHDIEELRRIIRGKRYRTRMFCNDPERKRKVLNLIWSSPPMDHLWRRIQLIDDTRFVSGALNQLMDSSTNPFEVTQRRCVDALRCRHGTDLKVLLHHLCAPEFVGGGEEARAGIQHAITEDFINSVLDMDSHVWWRCARVFDWWPFRALKLHLGSLSWAERLALAQEVFAYVAI
jgi:hypothetical protein